MGGALPGRGLGRGRGPPIISGEAPSVLIAAPPGRERLPDALRVVGTSFLLITPTPYWVSKKETEVSASCRRRAKIVVKICWGPLPSQVRLGSPSVAGKYFFFLQMVLSEESLKW